MNDENNISLGGIFSEGYGINPKKLWRMRLDEKCGKGRGKYIKMVISYLLSYTGGGTRECWPSIDTISTDLECSRDIVIEALQNAESLKMIAKERMFPNDPLRKNNKYTLKILDSIEVDCVDLRGSKCRLSTSDGTTYEVASFDCNNNNNNNNKFNNNNNNKELYKKTNISRPSSAKEVTEYAKSIGFELDGEYFIAKNDSIGWVTGKARNPIINWKSVVQTWKKNDAKWKTEKEKSCAAPRKSITTGQEIKDVGF